MLGRRQLTAPRSIPAVPCQHRGSALTDAERARKHRRRERDGLQHLAIDVPYAVVDLLITERYLTESEAADRHAIEKAVETFLADQVRLR